MTKAIPIFLVAVAGLFLSGCNKSPSSSPSLASSGTAASPGDAIEKKLQELAGKDATNCGRLQSQAADQMDAAAKCSIEAAQQKHPFYVAYDLPGMTIAVAGNSEGRLFTVQTQQAGANSAGGAAGLASGACPSELRVAPSGRVTCYAPGTFGMGMNAPHGGASMPPATGQNPHQGLGIPPGQSNPHQPKSSMPAEKQQ